MRLPNNFPLDLHRKDCTRSSFFFIRKQKNKSFVLENLTIYNSNCRNTEFHKNNFLHNQRIKQLIIYFTYAILPFFSSIYIRTKTIFTRFLRPSIKDQILIRCHIRNHSSTLSRRKGTPLTYIGLAGFSSLIIIGTVYDYFTL